MNHPSTILVAAALGAALLQPGTAGLVATYGFDGGSLEDSSPNHRDFVGSGGGAARLIFSTEHNTPGAGTGLFNGVWTGHPTAVRDGLWHHVVWASDGTTLTLYTDGLASAGAFQAADLLAATVRLGNRSGDGASGQAGRLIDDVYLYDHALDQTKVDALMAATAPAPQTTTSSSPPQRHIPESPSAGFVDLSDSRNKRSYRAPYSPQ